MYSGGRDNAEVERFEILFRYVPILVDARAAYTSCTRAASTYLYVAGKPVPTGMFFFFFPFRCGEGGGQILAANGQGQRQRREIQGDRSISLLPRE